MDPLELSSFRFFNLALFFLREGKTEEEVKELDKELQLLDSVKHPLHMLYYNPKKTVKPKQSRSSPVSAEQTHSKPSYVPSWWRGDAANAKIAKNLMKQLP